ncbi:hypothetical protein ACFVT5_10615 [Streptomyces sp. NPDC058001]|uniref:hypothetical protein n=1 Tax=Streptomyces sp. NPDC058001 TaxID=3346300 RepID=UPI0036E6B93B
MTIATETRIRRTATTLLLALGLGAGLVGCGSDDGPGRSDLNPSSTAVATTEKTPTPSNTDNTASRGPCYDGRCRITVSPSTHIEVDPRFGVGGIRIVDIGPTGLALEATGTAGLYLGTAVSEGGTGSLNQLGFKVVSISGRKAVLDIHPA